MLNTCNSSYLILRRILGTEIKTNHYAREGGTADIREDDTKMNTLLKVIILLWLGFSATFIWVGCAMIGLFLFISNFAFMYHVTPFIGLAGAICIINCGIRVYKSNPFDYIELKVKGLFGKAHIQCKEDSADFKS